MRAGQFIYYISQQITWNADIYPDYDSICYLPGLFYAEIRKSPYRLILQAY